MSEFEIDEDPRLHAIMQRFAYQFREPNLGHYFALGWSDLVEQTCIAADQLIPQAERATFKWRQIKQKFGDLRMYYRSEPVQLGDDVVNASVESSAEWKNAIRDLVSSAEVSSFSICEDCGAAGQRRSSSGYARTLCDLHADDNE